jgi:hypothetical protein
MKIIVLELLFNLLTKGYERFKLNNHPTCGPILLYVLVNHFARKSKLDANFIAQFTGQKLLDCYGSLCFLHTHNLISENFEPLIENIAKWVSYTGIAQNKKTRKEPIPVLSLVNKYREIIHKVYGNNIKNPAIYAEFRKLVRRVSSPVVGEAMEIFFGPNNFPNPTTVEEIMQKFVKFVDKFSQEREMAQSPP